MTLSALNKTLLCAFLNLFTSFGLIYGCANMIQSHSYVLNTVPCIFVVPITYCSSRKKPIPLEILGLAVTITGVVVMLFDKSA